VKCEVNDLINLSAESNGTHFVNPNGILHDLFTLTRINGVFTDRRAPSTEFSWFPGYAWSVIYCANCTTHLGWRFTSPRLLPKEFYGITRRAFKMAEGEQTD